MARTETVDLSEQHLRAAVPRHLCKLVDSGYDQRRQKAVDLFVDDHHGDALAIGLETAEIAPAKWVAAIQQRAAAFRGIRFGGHVLSHSETTAAPWAVGQLDGRSGVALATLVPTSRSLGDRISSLLGPVWCRCLADP